MLTLMCLRDWHGQDSTLSGCSLYAEMRLCDELTRLPSRYFFGDGSMWELLPAPSGLRDAAPELLAALAAVEAEVTVPHAPELSLARHAGHGPHTRQ